MGTRPRSRSNQEPTRLGVKFDFIWEVSLVEQELRNADASRIADAHDSRLGGHEITL
jgi:hypothetical protein